MTILSRESIHCSFSSTQQKFTWTKTSKRMARFFLSSLVVLSLLSAAAGILCFVLPQHSTDRWMVKILRLATHLGHTIKSFDVKMNFVGFGKIVMFVQFRFILHYAWSIRHVHVIYLSGTKCHLRRLVA